MIYIIKLIIKDLAEAIIEIIFKILIEILAEIIPNHIKIIPWKILVIIIIVLSLISHD